MLNEAGENVQNMPSETITIIKDKILSLPNRPPCILAQDVADIFITQVRHINQAVKRNTEKFANFGEKYCFRLTQEEFKNLKYKKVTSHYWGGNRHIPLAFTQYGIIMLANVLNMSRKIEACKLIVDMFVAMQSVQTVSPTNNSSEKILLSKDSIIKGQVEDLSIMRDLIRYQRQEISRLETVMAATMERCR